LRYNISMFSKIPRLRLAVIIFIFILMMFPANTVFGDAFGWAAKGSLFLFASDNGPRADPPAIVPSLGFSLTWQLLDFLRIEFSEDIYFSNYEFSREFGYPVACGLDSRYSFVIGFITAIQATGTFPIGNNGIMARVFGGPSADLRIITQAVGLHPTDIQEAEQQTKMLTDHFWGNGRWFMPVFGAGMDFPAVENYLIGFDLRVWFPMYKLWINDNTPAIDGWRFGISLRITPRVK